MKEWAELHKYALTVLAHHALRSTGGVEANLRLGRVVVFIVSTQRPDNAPPDDSPGTKFTLRDARLIEAEQAPWLADDRQHTNADFGEPGFRGDTQTADMPPAGLLPIVCLAEGTTFVVSSHLPVYRAVRHPDDTPLDAEMAGAFQDVNRLFVTFINNGIVFRPPPQGRAAPPDAGKMVRAGKGWKWKQERRAWYVMWTVLRSQDTRMFDTTLSATELWMRFWRW
ncbi:hypothetical protein LXA43DRAFT_1103366 [Ganoderma leucocontextum]|nr:hypothetical protein LXA43DRAFT_1103366 [Ganoderma leucocontextum]